MDESKYLRQRFFSRSLWFSPVHNQTSQKNRKYWQPWKLLLSFRPFFFRLGWPKNFRQNLNPSPHRFPDYRSPDHLILTAPKRCFVFLPLSHFQVRLLSDFECDSRKYPPVPLFCPDGVFPLILMPHSYRPQAVIVVRDTDWRVKNSCFPIYNQ